MIRCFVFDFDGTLAPSNDIKRRAFREVVNGTPEAAGRLNEILSAHPGADRHQIFALLCANVPMAGDAEALVARYSAICEAGIVPLLQNGRTRKLIEALIAQGPSVHIATATPRDAMVRILDTALLTPLFKSIHGRPQTKREAIGEIIEDGGLLPEDVVVIGDGDDDRDAAMAHRCHFVGVSSDAFELYANTTEAALQYLANALEPSAASQ